MEEVTGDKDWEGGTGDHLESRQRTPAGSRPVQGLRWGRKVGLRGWSGLRDGVTAGYEGPAAGLHLGAGDPWGFRLRSDHL